MITNTILAGHRQYHQQQELESAFIFRKTLNLNPIDQNG
jgi:hypothetical protein